MTPLKSPKQLEATVNAVAKYLDTIQNIRAKYVAKIAQLEAEMKTKLAPWEQNIEERLTSVATYAAFNPEIYQGGKTVHIGPAKLGHRKTPLAVSILDETQFIQMGSDMDMDCPFIFHKPFVDKNALKHTYQQDPDHPVLVTAQRKGLLSFTGGQDEFFIKIGDTTWKP